MRAADEKLIINELGPSSHEYTYLLPFFAAMLQALQKLQTKKSRENRGEYFVCIQFA